MEEKMIKPIGKIIESSYIIPLYQRNFAWGDREIKQLVTDLYRSMKRNQAAYFIGSLITFHMKSLLPLLAISAETL